MLEMRPDMNPATEENIDVRQMPLEDWLSLVYNPPENRRFLNVAFPTDEHRQEYIASINQRTEEDVYRLLYSFLIKSGTLGLYDQIKLQGLILAQERDHEMFHRMSRMQFYRRLVQSASGLSQVQPWEGITWILDLLPHFPKIAIEGLNAYIMAHIQFLPDWRVHGLYDAAEIIRAKFIGMPNTNAETIQFLSNLQPREFECIVERLYDAMEYETELTPPQNDGGRDVIARRQTPGQHEHLLIECKRYHNPVGVEIIQRLSGVVGGEKANKGVLVTTSRFTKKAREFANDNRIELITGDQLAMLLNEHLGPRWSLHIERLVAESQAKYLQPHTSSNMDDG
jgi:restriction system protein